MGDGIRELTVVLTLKDRFDYTEYFIQSAWDERLKYLVLDGSTGDFANEAFEKASLPNVTYRRFPPDVDFSDYMTKVDVGLSEVDTPFLLMMDNDDRTVYRGLNAAVEFLADHPTFALAGGDLVGHCNRPTDLGRTSWPTTLTSIRDLETPAPRERVGRNRISYRPIWNLVSRTSDFRRMWGRVCATEIKEPHLIEFAMADLMLSVGALKRLKIPHYIRLENQVTRAIHELPVTEDLTIGSESWWAQVDRLERLVAEESGLRPEELPGHAHRFQLLTHGAAHANGLLRPLEAARNLTSQLRVLPSSWLEAIVGAGLVLPLPIYRRGDP